ncbi:hypothetical protein B296_00002296 [Ensete ventricosum]|uniref:YTH domain-containing protein n=1 Tax=Ensete ventricosum TaxID=4639 RepID=A0A427A9W4_ENSVE|nr:hypothetical protein B296_00002296 [Ensete ventricosum]
MSYGPDLEWSTVDTSVTNHSTKRGGTQRLSHHTVPTPDVPPRHSLRSDSNTSASVRPPGGDQTSKTAYMSHPASHTCMYTEPCVSLASVTAAVYSLTGSPQNDKVNRACCVRPPTRDHRTDESPFAAAERQTSWTARSCLEDCRGRLLAVLCLPGSNPSESHASLCFRPQHLSSETATVPTTNRSLGRGLGLVLGGRFVRLSSWRRRVTQGSSAETCGSSNKESEVDQEPLVGEQGVYYYGYYYPGLAFYFSKLLIFSPQTLVSPGVLPQQVAYGPELVPAYPWDPSFFFTDEIQGSITVDPTNPHYKPNLTSHGHTRALSKTMPTSKSVLGTKGSSLSSDVSHPITVQNQTHKPVKKGAAAVLSKGYVPINKFNVYANQGKGELLYSKSAINLKENGRSWVDDEKLKVKNKLNSHGDFDLLNEQNRGPRTNGSRSSSQSGVDVLEALGAEKNDSGSISSAIVNKDEYNRPDFRTQYEHALFFVIKSYSEDDIHKSIKYNVWASTPNGNKRLDNAFQVAQEKMAEKNSKCPVFLFFSNSRVASSVRGLHPLKPTDLGSFLSSDAGKSSSAYCRIDLLLELLQLLFLVKSDASETSFLMTTSLSYLYHPLHGSCTPLASTSSSPSSPLPFTYFRLEQSRKGRFYATSTPLPITQRSHPAATTKGNPPGSYQSSKTNITDCHCTTCTPLHRCTGLPASPSPICLSRPPQEHQQGVTVVFQFEVQRSQYNKSTQVQWAVPPFDGLLCTLGVATSPLQEPWHCDNVDQRRHRLDTFIPSPLLRLPPSEPLHLPQAAASADGGISAPAPFLSDLCITGLRFSFLSSDSSQPLHLPL